MKIYIDIEYLKSLVNYVQEKEIMKLIKENFDVYYTFDESDIKKEKRQKIQKIELWQKELTTGRNGRSIYYNSSFPIQESLRIEHDINFIPKDILQSVFLVRDKTCLPEGVIACELGDELKTLRNLLIERKCVPAKFYYTRPEEDEEVLEWEIVSRNVSPCTDIIINDLYLFAQSEIEYEANSYKLIKELCKNSVNQVVNIVIVTKLNFKMREKRGDEWKDVFHTINTTAIRKRIKSISKDITNQEAKVTIIALDDEDYARSRIHDRTIFTNYKLFISGDSFKYYLENGANSTSFISHGIWFGVCSLYDEGHNMIARRFVKDVQDVIKSVKNHLIIGDRESNFLNIPRDNH